MINEVRRGARILSIIGGFLIFFCIFGPWVSYDGSAFSLLQFYEAIYNAGGITEFANGNIQIVPASFYLMAGVISSVLFLINTLMLVGGKEAKIIKGFARGGQFLCFAGFYGFGGYEPLLCAFLAPIVTVIEFIVRLYFESRVELREQQEEIKEREKKEREEKTRRLEFQGKYTSSFYKIIYKNFRYNVKHYVLLIVSGVMAFTSLFVMFGMEQVLHQIHTDELLFIGEGLQKIIVDAMPFVVVINAVLMGLSFLYYMRNKLHTDSIFVTLGIRQKAMVQILIMEYIGSLICSIVVGLIAGNVIIIFLKGILSAKLGVAFIGHISCATYLWVLGSFILISLLSAAVNYEVYLSIMRAEGEITRLKKDRIPRRFLKQILVISILLMGIAVILFSKRSWGEDITLVYIFVIGIWLLLLSVAAQVIHKRIMEKRYYHSHMLHLTPFIYCFKKSIINISILTMIHFLILAVFMTPVISGMSAKPLEALYPYDFVCMASSDDVNYFKDLETQYHLEMQNYKMLRMTTVQGDEMSIGATFNNGFQSVLWPQGQHVAISETVYKELRETLGMESKNLKLDNEKVHLVYQQDSSFRAHPFDWYLEKSRPNIRVGQPLDEYVWVEREELYPSYDVQSEEVEILTGMFGRGKQENIIVLSDNFFEQLSKQSQEEYGEAGITELYLINAVDNNEKQVKDALESFRDKHKSDSRWDSEIQPCYDKSQMLQDAKTERFMRIVVNTFLVIMLTVCAAYILYIKFSFDAEDIKHRYQMLHYLGIRENEKKDFLRKEMNPFIRIPLLCGIVFAIIFIGITFGIRMYSLAEMFEFIKWGILLWGAYITVQILWYQWIKKITMRLIL